MAAPKTYYYRGEVISTDGDKLDNSELFKRKLYVNTKNIVNKPLINADLRFTDNFSDAYTLTSSINAKYNLLNNPSNFSTYTNAQILNNINHPISKEWQIIGSGIYALTCEGYEQCNQRIHEEKITDSRVTDAINKSSPFIKSSKYNVNV